MSKYQTNYGNVPLIKCENIFEFSDGLAPVKVNKKWGFIDKRGEMIIPPQYDFTMGFSEGLACVQMGDSYTFIDTRGNCVTPSFEDCGDFHDGLAYFCEGDLYGFINKKGKVAIPPQYESAIDFSDGLASVMIDGKNGFINTEGEIVIPCIYEDTDDLVSGFICVEDGERNFIIDKEGNKIFSWKEEDYEMYMHRDELLILKKDGALSVLNLSSKQTIAIPEAKNIKYYAEGVMTVEFLDGKYGCMNSTGGIIVPPQYDELFRSNGDLIAFREGKNWGFIDKQNNVVIPAVYSQKGIFYDGMCYMKQNGKEYCITNRNEICFEIQRTRKVSKWLLYLIGAAVIAGIMWKLL